jgi:hypothetical protein
MNLIAFFKFLECSFTSYCISDLINKLQTVKFELRNFCRKVMFQPANKNDSETLVTMLNVFYLKWVLLQVIGLVL